MGEMLLCLVLLLSIELTQGCILNASSFSATYPSSSRGENVWTVGVKTVEFTYNITCTSRGARIRVELQKNNGNSRENLVDSMVFRKFVWSVYSKSLFIINLAPKTTHNDTISVTLFINVDSVESMNGSRILIKESELSELYYIAAPLVFQNCTAESLPNYVSADEKHYQYMQEAKVRCRNSADNLFDNGIRVDSAKIRCGKHADWEQYSLRCHKGQVIDFNEENITIASNKPTIITCAAKDNANTVSVTFGNATTVKQTKYWSSVMIDSDYHDSDIWCKEFDNAGKLLVTRWTKLNVLYPPKLSPKSSDFRFEMEAGTSGEIVIEFNSNPATTCKNIQLLRNGTKLENMYVLVNMTIHKVVVHFIKVDGDVFGDYIMSIKSPLPFNTTINVTFEISEKHSTSPTQSPLASSSAALSITFGILLALVIIALVMRFYITKENESFSPSNNVVEVRPEANVRCQGANGAHEKKDEEENYIEIDLVRRPECDNSDGDTYIIPNAMPQVNDPIDENPYDY